MHPATCEYLIAARMADLHRKAGRNRPAHAARRANTPPPRSVPARTCTGLARRVIALAGGRSPSPTR